jgi:hypothetical protein
MKNTGSRAEVWHGNARFTSGRLTKNDLHKNKLGRIVSKKKSLKHSKDPVKNPLLKNGFQQKKGSNTFGPLKSVDETKTSKSGTKTSKSGTNKSNKSNKSTNKTSLLNNIKNLFQ